MWVSNIRVFTVDFGVWLGYHSVSFRGLAIIPFFFWEFPVALKVKEGVFRGGGGWNLGVAGFVPALGDGAWGSGLLTRGAGMAAGRIARRKRLRACAREGGGRDGGGFGGNAGREGVPGVL